MSCFDATTRRAEFWRMGRMVDEEEVVQGRFLARTVGGSLVWGSKFCGREQWPCGDAWHSMQFDSVIARPRPVLRPSGLVPRRVVPVWPPVRQARSPARYRPFLTRRSLLVRHSDRVHLFPCSRFVRAFERFSHRPPILPSFLDRHLPYPRTPSPLPILPQTTLSPPNQTL